MTPNSLNDAVNDSLDMILDTMDGLENREEKKKLLMSLIVTVYEEAYEAANPLPIVYSEKLN